MLTFLPGPIKGFLASLFFALNTVFWTIPLYVTSLIRLIPAKPVEDWANRLILFFSEKWISTNSLEIALLHKIKWTVKLPEGLSLDRSYLVTANHQSWVDIVVLQHVFNKKIPFLRFFLKDQLRWIPLLGGAWKALDFPFMKRHTKAYLAQHPEKRGEDLEATKRACEKLRGKNVSILNFLEGTRFTPEKHASSNSPFKNLLMPKTGGVAFVLQAMGHQFDSLLDVTIFYPDRAQSLWGLFSGRINEVVVWVDKIAIPKQFLDGDYLGNETFRHDIQEWLKEIWAAKDARISALKTQYSLS